MFVMSRHLFLLYLYISHKWLSLSLRQILPVFQLKFLLYPYKLDSILSFERREQHNRIHYYLEPFLSILHHSCRRILSCRSQVLFVRLSCFFSSSFVIFVRDGVVISSIVIQNVSKSITHGSNSCTAFIKCSGCAYADASKLFYDFVYFSTCS